MGVYNCLIYMTDVSGKFITAASFRYPEHDTIILVLFWFMINILPGIHSEMPANHKAYKLYRARSAVIMKQLMN